MFVLPVRLIVGDGYSATASAAALLPLVAELFFLSRWTGRWASTIGPRIPLTAGACLVAAGFVLLGTMGGGSYRRGFLPGITVLGLGMAMTVAPLTTAVMGALGDARAGLASGINNAVARTAGLAGVSAVALIASARSPRDLAVAFPRIMLVAAALALGGAVIAAVFVRSVPQETG
jgi:hypothetical protein